MDNHLLLRQTHGINSSLVLISGASGGLGKALAVECASRGWDLYLTDLNAASLETLAIPLYPELNEAQQDRVISMVQGYFNNVDGKALNYFIL